MQIAPEQKYQTQLEKLEEYLDENDKDQELYDLIFKQNFDFGILDKTKNLKGYNKFNQAIQRYFWVSYRGVTIQDLEEGVIKISGDMELDGGRYAFQLPFVTYKAQPSSIYFNCERIDEKSLCPGGFQAGSNAFVGCLFAFAGSISGSA